MKVELFKKLIKEAVREVLKEELSVMFVEQKQAPVTQVQQVTKDYTPVTPKEPVNVPGNPLMEMLNMTRNSMTREEYTNLVSANSSMVQAPGLGMNTVAESFQAGPAPGIGLSTLDFVKNAGAIYKASVEKDRARFGG